MANIDHEKASDSDSYPQVAKHGRRDDVAYALDERRRAALADVDNAEFSYVFELFYFTLSHP
jgi:PHS family inorganic phosphate transporter-like MFS transporter